MRYSNFAEGAHVRHWRIAYVMLPKHHTTTNDDNVLHDVLAQQGKTKVTKSLLREEHEWGKGKKHVNEHEQQNGFHKTAADEQHTQSTFPGCQDLHGEVIGQQPKC